MENNRVVLSPPEYWEELGSQVVRDQLAGMAQCRQAGAGEGREAGGQAYVYAAV